MSCRLRFASRDIASLVYLLFIAYIIFLKQQRVYKILDIIVRLLPLFNEKRAVSFVVLWPSDGARLVQETITKGNIFKVHWPLPSIGRLLIGRPWCRSCPSPVASKRNGLNYSHDGRRANLPDVYLLLVKIERWILCADYD